MTPTTAPGDISLVCGHVREAVGTYGYDRIELEWRIGRRQAGFRPGVAPEAWARVQAALDSSPAFQKAYTESCERMGDQQGIKCLGDDKWMHKKRLANVDSDTNQGPWSIRASVSLEELDTTPAPIALKYSRNKRRWSYRHRCWSIDLTRVQSNLPNDLDSDQDVYEIEVELVDPGILFERSLDNVVVWGWQIAQDMCGLMAR